MADRLVLWHPEEDREISPGHFDWGDSPQGSSADRRFRVKNESTTIDALSIEISFSMAGDPTPSIVDDLLLSKDGQVFTAGVTLSGGLDPEEISEVLTLRRNSPPTSALGAWEPVLTASTDQALADAVATMPMVVSTNFPVPHIWFLSPNSLENYSESFLIVGQGFGASQGLSTVWWARGEPEQQELEVISWGEVASTYADPADRRIDRQDVGNTNVNRQTIRTSVPRDQSFGTYDVFVETDDTAVVETADIYGGTASSSFDDDLDGGTSSSTLTTSINGGGA